MKLNKIKLAMAASALLLTSGAYAADGTINFTGTIVDSTCVVNTNGSSASTGTVDLGKVSSSSLATADQTSAPTPFTISVTGCTKNSQVAIQFDGTGNATKSSILALNGVAQGSSDVAATNVGVAIYNQGENEILALNSKSTVQTTDTDGKATFPFVAKYYATGTATAGVANATATFNIAYQ